jgi:hypothetical protein
VLASPAPASASIANPLAVPVPDSAKEHFITGNQQVRRLSTSGDFFLVAVPVAGIMKVGLLDEGLGLRFACIDLLIRLGRAGFRVYVAGGFGTTALSGWEEFQETAGSRIGAGKLCLSARYHTGYRRAFLVFGAELCLMAASIKSLARGHIDRSVEIASDVADFFGASPPGDRFPAGVRGMARCILFWWGLQVMGLLRVIRGVVFTAGVCCLRVAFRLLPTAFRHPVVVAINDAMLRNVR